jgi:hypothetical protein
MMNQGRAPNTGTTGSEKLQTIFGKTILQFKKSYELTPFFTRFLNTFKKYFGQISCLIRRKMTQPINETMAYHLSRELKFDVVPATKLARIDGTTGMMQLWITNGYVPAGQDDHDVKTLDPALKKSSYTQDEIILFQKFALFDYLLGNLDRHYQNWILSKDCQNNIQKIIAIDNANSFPTKDPKPFFFGLFDPGHNQYMWKELKIAEAPLTEPTKEFIRDNLSEEKIQKLLTHLESVIPEPATYLTEEVKQLFLKRAAKIRHAIGISCLTN